MNQIVGTAIASGIFVALMIVVNVVVQRLRPGSSPRFVAGMTILSLLGFAAVAAVVATMLP